MPPLESPAVTTYAQHIFYARRPAPEPDAAHQKIPRTHTGTSARQSLPSIMPRLNPPPTPGSSSDIRGKEGLHMAPAFNLPPTAFNEPDRASTASATPSANGSDSSYRPVSPTSPAGAARKRPAPTQGPVITQVDFALPPPPTRSRKIIQIKPKDSEQVSAQPNATSQQASGDSTATRTGGKKKQNANTTAAGRKIARKTAHSLIERRRRSKMNEEFGVLKDMIPACKGQEMHKLAILQASIDYLRYLEQCVADLKTQTGPTATLPAQASSQRPAEEDEDDDDDEMEDDAAPAARTINSGTTSKTLESSTSNISLSSLSQVATTTTSPSIYPTTAPRNYSISSATSAYSPFFHSNQPSPAFGPRLHQPFSTSSITFGLGSPALNPVDSSHSKYNPENGMENLEQVSKRTRGSEQQMNQEATAALLLMLNHDRRNWTQGGQRTQERGSTGRSSTGLSVRDLLSG